MGSQAQKREEEYAKLEQLAHERVMSVCNEMIQIMMDSEERYRGQIETIENELWVEKEKQNRLEQQMEQLLENAGIIVTPQATESVRQETKSHSLQKSRRLLLPFDHDGSLLRGICVWLPCHHPLIWRILRWPKSLRRKPFLLSFCSRSRLRSHHIRFLSNVFNVGIWHSWPSYDQESTSLWQWGFLYESAMSTLLASLSLGHVSTI